jgi:hypothetical protein
LNNNLQRHSRHDTRKEISEVSVVFDERSHEQLRNTLTLLNSGLLGLVNDELLQLLLVAVRELGEVQITRVNVCRGIHNFR